MRVFTNVRGGINEADNVAEELVNKVDRKRCLLQWITIPLFLINFIGAVFFSFIIISIMLCISRPVTLHYVY